MVTKEQGLGLLVFSLAGKEYAFEMRYVREVVTALNIIPVPQSADCVEGVVSLRNKVIPVINLRKKFALPEGQPIARSRLIVVQLESHEVGVVVDVVVGVSKLMTAQIAPPDEVLKEANYLMGVGKVGDRLILLIDVPRLLSSEEQDGIRTVYDQIEKEFIEVGEVPEDRDTLERDSTRVLSFVLGKENYGVDVTQAKEVFRSEHFTKIPGTPAFVVGVTNLRGQIVSIIDIRPFLGLPATRPAQEMWLIVTDVRGSLVGLMVDRINEAVMIQRSAIQPPVATISEAQAGYTTGQIALESSILVMLDLAKIMSCMELEQLRGTHG